MRQAGGSGGNLSGRAGVHDHIDADSHTGAGNGGLGQEAERLAQAGIADAGWISRIVSDEENAGMISKQRRHCGKSVDPGQKVVLHA